VVKEHTNYTVKPYKWLRSPCNLFKSFAFLKTNLVILALFEKYGKSSVRYFLQAYRNILDAK
jgi:hypothetical protein